MSKRAKWVVGGALALIAGAAVLVGLAIHYANLPETVDDLETIVLGQSRYVPGSQAALRVLVREGGGGQAIPGAAVTVALQPARGGRPGGGFSGSPHARRGAAAGRDTEFSIAEGKGNKVFRQTVETSPYGIAGQDFQLANEVNTGNYKITAQMGNTSSERTGIVEHYVLPKFEVTWATERSFYLPGERGQGSITAED